MFFTKKEDKSANNNLSKISALLIHAAKIDENFSLEEEIIIKKALEKLEKDQLWQSGKIKKYHSKISEIIRSYIEARFKVIALELTTDEIIMNIRNKTSADNIEELNKILARADLAKCAKSKPIDLENEESMLIAIKFVEQTTEINDDE